MTTIMKSSSFELAVNNTGIDITSHDDGVRLYVPLTPGERRTMAAALVPYDRGGITVDPASVASGLVTIAEHARDAAVARAEATVRELEKAKAPEVAMHELAEVIRRGWGNGEFGSPHGVLDAVWRYLHPEPEAAVDPVEAKAREVATIAYPEEGFVGAFDVADDDAKAAYRRIARHLVWQEGNL